VFLSSPPFPSVVAEPHGSIPVQRRLAGFSILSMPLNPLQSPTNPRINPWVLWAATLHSPAHDAGQYTPVTNLCCEWSTAVSGTAVSSRSCCTDHIVCYLPVGVVVDAVRQVHDVDVDRLKGGGLQPGGPAGQSPPRDQTTFPC